MPSLETSFFDRLTRLKRVPCVCRRGRHAMPSGDRHIILGRVCGKGALSGLCHVIAGK